MFVLFLHFGRMPLSFFCEICGRIGNDMFCERKLVTKDGFNRTKKRWGRTSLIHSFRWWCLGGQNLLRAGWREWGSRPRAFVFWSGVWGRKMSGKSRPSGRNGTAAPEARGSTGSGMRGHRGRILVKVWHERVKEGHPKPALFKHSGAGPHNCAIGRGRKEAEERKGREMVHRQKPRRRWSITDVDRRAQRGGVYFLIVF